MMRNYKTYFVSAKTGANVQSSFDAFLDEIALAEERANKGNKKGLGLGGLLKNNDEKNKPKTPREKKEDVNKDKDDKKDKNQKKDKEKEKSQTGFAGSEMATDDDFFSRLEGGYKKK
jgi:hypothetical protein